MAYKTENSKEDAATLSAEDGGFRLSIQISKSA